MDRVGIRDSVEEGLSGKTWLLGPIQHMLSANAKIRIDV